jgi:thiamine transporter
LRFNARSLAYAGVLTSMSFALSYIKLWDMPQGGSITLVSTLPLMMYAYLFGTKKGVFVGFVYGTLQAVQDPYIVHPAQFLLDYSVGYTMIGFAGVFKLKSLQKLPQIQFALGASVGGILRYISQTLSGVFAFGAYALDAGASSIWGYSLAYNSYVLVDVIIVIAVGAILLSSKTVVNEMNKYPLLSK